MLLTATLCLGAPEGPWWGRCRICTVNPPEAAHNPLLLALWALPSEMATAVTAAETCLGILYPVMGLPPLVGGCWI